MTTLASQQPTRWTVCIFWRRKNESGLIAKMKRRKSQPSGFQIEMGFRYHLGVVFFFCSFPGSVFRQDGFGRVPNFSWSFTVSMSLEGSICFEKSFMSRCISWLKMGIFRLANDRRECKKKAAVEGGYIIGEQNGWRHKLVLHFHLCDTFRFQHQSFFAHLYAPYSRRWFHCNNTLVSLQQHLWLNTESPSNRRTIPELPSSKRFDPKFTQKIAWGVLEQTYMSYMLFVIPQLFGRKHDPIWLWYSFRWVM